MENQDPQIEPSQPQAAEPTTSPNPQSNKKILLISSVLVVLVLALSMGAYFANKSKNDGGEPQPTATPSASPIPSPTATPETATQPVTWMFDHQAQAWVPSSTPPACPDPFVFAMSPVDVSKATSVLYPGQTRGGNYKPHGGFAFDNNTNTEVKVVMPFDGYLVSGSRYIEGGELQYILDFVSECGIAIRFDHLAVLSESLTALTNAKLPEPKVDDSRGTFINPPVLFKAGDVVATKIGFEKTLNVGMDFGVYDYRTRNAASANSDFQQKHGTFSATTYYGVCWFDMLPGDDATRANSLPSRDQKMGKTSDYCK